MFAWTPRDQSSASPSFALAANLRYLLHSDRFSWHFTWTPVADTHDHHDRAQRCRLIAGRALVDGLRGRSPGVIAHGRVDDLDDYYRSTRAVIAPIRYGSGVRIKILEAFGRGRPVVSTTIGAEGIPAVDGTHLLIADEPHSMAQALVRVLRDDALAQRLSAQARELAQG